MAESRQIDRRADCLPVIGRHAIVVDAEAGPGLVSLGCPAGAPVFAVFDGRVASIRPVDAGELVLRSTSDATRAHYRRLSPGSVELRQGDLVEAGQLLGRVARVAGDHGLPGLRFGLQDDDGTWLDAGRALAGAADPGMVVRAEPTGDGSGGHRPPVALDPPASRPRQPPLPPIRTRRVGAGPPMPPDQLRTGSRGLTAGDDGRPDVRWAPPDVAPVPTAPRSEGEPSAPDPPAGHPDGPAPTGEQPETDRTSAGEGALARRLVSRRARPKRR